MERRTGINRPSAYKKRRRRRRRRKRRIIRYIENYTDN